MMSLALRQAKPQLSSFAAGQTFRRVIMPDVGADGAGRDEMRATFYDVKERQKVEADVTEKVVYGEENRKRYALKGKTADGRALTKFVSKDEWDRTQV